MSIPMENQAPFSFFFVCFSDAQKGIPLKLVCPALKRFKLLILIFFGSSFLSFVGGSICIGESKAIPLHTPLKLIVDSFSETYQPIFTRDSMGVTGIDFIPPYAPRVWNREAIHTINLVCRGELPCFSAYNSLILDVQNRGGNPLFKSGIFSLKEEVLRGGSISNDFSFPLVSEHTSHFFIVHKNQGEV